MIWTLALLLFQPELNCEEPMSQAEMRDCERQGYREAEVELESAWEAALALAREFDSLAEEGGETGAHVAELEAAQEAWFAYRQAHCTSLSNLYRGGSIYSTIVAGCMADLTRDRVEQLRQYVAD